jgi:transposase
MREEGQSVAEEVEWFAGIDWASQSHQVCLVDARGACLGERAVAHGGPGIEELCDWLITRTGATPEVIGVAIEGPVVEALLERGFCVYGINPKQLDRFRDRFTVAGAKDDRRDAHVLADSLRTDRHAFRRLSNDEPVIVKLREWSRMTDDLQQERTRLASRMREQLWRYYPQMLELADDLASPRLDLHDPRGRPIAELADRYQRSGVSLNSLAPGGVGTSKTLSVTETNE